MSNGHGSLLIVDDEAMVRKMLARYLGEAGFAITEARDGAEALKLVESNSFDLVLLDVLLPDLGGLEVLRRIRQGQPATTLPVLMATVKDNSSDVVEALGQGA